MRAIISSLADFAVAGLWPRSALAKAIVVVLIIKLFAIAGFKLFLFPSSEQPAADAAAIARVIGPSTLPQ
jgi:hypothetical protein